MENFNGEEIMRLDRGVRLNLPTAEFFAAVGCIFLAGMQVSGVCFPTLEESSQYEAYGSILDQENGR
jgi:hypothetical protein